MLVTNSSQLATRLLALNDCRKSRGSPVSLWGLVTPSLPSEIEKYSTIREAFEKDPCSRELVHYQMQFRKKLWDLEDAVDANSKEPLSRLQGAALALRHIWSALRYFGMSEWDTKDWKHPRGKIDAKTSCYLAGSLKHNEVYYLSFGKLIAVKKSGMWKLVEPELLESRGVSVQTFLERIFEKTNWLVAGKEPI